MSLKMIILAFTLIVLISFSHCLSSQVRSDADVFHVKDNATGLVCLVIRLNATFHVPYNTTDNISKSVQTTLLHNAETNVTGSCLEGWNSRQGESITFTWKSIERTPVWNFTIYLEQNSANVSFVSQMALSYYRSPALFPNATDVGKIHNIYAVPNYNSTVRYFDTTIGQYFECINKETINFQEQTKLDLDNMMISAFRKNSTTTDFLGERNQCSFDKLINNLIPIVVGVTLAVLIIIIMIAYIVGRRHSHAGYQSI
jgi:lysosomal-associated membrane protein 1/2